MKYLRKFWIRFIISLISGGMLAEIAHIRLGDKVLEVTGTITLIGAALTFSFISLIVWFDKYRYFYFPPKDKNQS